MRAQKLEALKIPAFGKYWGKIIALCQISRKKLWRKNLWNEACRLSFPVQCWGKQASD